MMRDFSGGVTRQNRVVLSSLACSASSVRARDLRTVQRSADGEAELAADMPRDLLIVAGHHLHGDAEVGERRQRLTGPRLRRIEEGQEAGEGQLRLVGDVGVLAVRFDLAPRDPQRPVAIGAKRVECRLGGLARRGIQRQRRRSLPLITGREAEDVFRRALHHDETPAAAFDEDRNPAPLEIERHFVDLAPGRRGRSCRPRGSPRPADS